MSNNPQFPEKKDNRNLIYGILIAALVMTWAYIIYDKSQSKEQITLLQTEVKNVDSARLAIQQEFDNASARLDSITTNNIELQGTLAERNQEIQQLKNNIRVTLNKKNATADELSKAKALIAELNGKITDLFAEVEKLKAENQQLTNANEQLTTDKNKLTAEKGELQQNLNNTSEAKRRIEDVASTLLALNINITAIDIRNGGREKETSTAKRADVFRVSFDIAENRVAPTGTKDFFVIVSGPDGKPFGEGMFKTREDGEREFTNKVTVNYEQGKRLPVSFNWKPDGQYATGNYRVEIYHNGYKIGEGVKSLKKGGIFG